MIWMKNFLLVCLSPLTVGLSLIAFGVICLWLRWLARLGSVLAILGFALIVWAGLGHFGRDHIESLERRYAPLNPAALPAATASQIRYIVILGAGQVSDPRLPVTSQIGDRSLYRLVEGIRLHRRLPGTRLVLTGGPGIDTVPNADVMASVAGELGVQRDELVLLSHPRDTREEARAVKTLAGTAPFILVTSAAHMPRAMRVFEAEGLHPLPAPAHYVSPRSPTGNPSAFLPTPRGLVYTEQALYEILGSIREWWRK
jgi:uncharacterized SAM-binding protein YcdF (DUF218 family)